MSLTVVVILAVAIGAVTAVFRIAHTPSCYGRRRVADPDRVVLLQRTLAS